MFDRNDLRHYIAIAWIIAFISLWGLLQHALPGKEMMNHLNQLESAVVNKNWPVAKQTMNEIENTWQRNKLIVQITNGGEEVVIFSERLGEAKVLVGQEHDNAFAPIGAMKQIFSDIGRVFPGP